MKTRNTIIDLFIVIISVGINMPVLAQDVNKAESQLSEMSLEDLLNVEVTTTSKYAEKLADAPGVISVVTRDEMDRFGGITLREILERVPSLNSASVYMTDRTMLAARG